MTAEEIANVIRDFSIDIENWASGEQAMDERMEMVSDLRKFADRVEEEGRGEPFDSAPVTGSPGCPAPLPPLGTYHLHRHGEER